MLSMRELRGRMETASVLAWLSGFDVPREDIRNLWVDFEALPWEKTLLWALAGENGSAQDAVDILVTGERQKQHKKKDGYSDVFVDVVTRMSVDPAFNAKTHLPSERLAKILTGDAPKLVGAEIAPLRARSANPDHLAHLTAGISCRSMPWNNRSLPGHACHLSQAARRQHR